MRNGFAVGVAVFDTKHIRAVIERDKSGGNAALIDKYRRRLAVSLIDDGGFGRDLPVLIGDEIFGVGSLGPAKRQSKARFCGFRARVGVFSASQAQWEKRGSNRRGIAFLAGRGISRGARKHQAFFGEKQLVRRIRRQRPEHDEEENLVPSFRMIGHIHWAYRFFQPEIEELFFECFSNASICAEVPAVAIDCLIFNGSNQHLSFFVETCHFYGDIS